jgi:exopolyphosphatase/guanosine-5'-triphosphate,3'-diphosphate pyrophosphatase
MPFAAPRDAAVIDIGSNSVRLVVYRLEGRAIWTVFNEKVLAGLGRDLGDGGKLNPEGVAQTLAALKRFRAVLEAVKPAETFVAATAAVREAKDGAAFVAMVKAATGLSMRVLSGEEEARYAALGVLAGTPDATGVVGDLGGASLELIRLEPTGAGLGVTLPLGPFSLGLSDGFDAERVRRLCAQRLAPVAQAFRTDVFHAVGGAWRNLALLHMRLSDYPLHVVHQYSISRGEALDAARLVAHQSKSSLDRIEGMSKKRSETLPLRRRGAGEPDRDPRPQAHRDLGLRGARRPLFEAMPPGVRRLDPLIEGCASLGARQGVADELGAALDAGWPRPWACCRPVSARCATRCWSRPPAAWPTWARACTRTIAPTWCSTRCCAPRSPARPTPSAPSWPPPPSPATPPPSHPPELQVLERLLTPGRLKRARALGAAIRLGCDLSGRSAPLLVRSRLAIDKGDLLLTAEPGYADLLLGEQTAKRANTLATLLGLKLKITAL